MSDIFLRPDLAYEFFSSNFVEVVFDVGPTLYTCYSNILCLLGQKL